MKKKLLCMLLSAAMVFNTGNLSALTLVYAEEAETSVAENSASSESTTVQTEETAENAASQESEKLATTESKESDTNVDSSTKDGTQTEESEIENDTAETEKTSTEESSIIETSTEEPSSKQESNEEITTKESAIQDTSITETEEITETETEDITSSEDKNIENALDTERTTKLEAAYHSMDEIKAFLDQQKAEKADKVTFAQDPSVTAPYRAGVLSDAALESAAAMINQIRFIAGLPYEVTFDKEYSQYSQAAALVNYINGELSNKPSQPGGISEELYKQGQEGASNSNLAYHESDAKPLNETIVDSWMAGDDSNNLSSLESRRWILNPSMGKVGFGAVKGSKGTYSAMYATDCSGNNETIFGVAWPAQNTPIEYFDAAYPWSVSTGEQLEAKDIQVTLTRKSDGKEWTFAKESADGVFYVDNDSYGQKGCIIFQPNMQDITEFVDGDAFQVEITNNKEMYLSYNVTFFSLTEKEEKLTIPKASIASGEVVAKESKLVLTSEEEAAVYYTVDGSEPTLDSTLYTEPISIEADITVKAFAAKEGYENSEIVTFTYTVEEDVPVRYTITFESNGGTIVPAQSIQENEKMEQPETPVKEGYLLDGWFKEAECETIWDFEKDTVTADITLYAKWTEDPTAAVYTVSFELQEHGTPIESLTVKTGELLTAPEAPTAEGYQFEGWFKEPECTNAWDFAADTILSDTILYAKWTEEVETETQTIDVANTYLITFDLQGIGTQIDPITVNNGDTFAAPEVPTAEGYTFAEWYREADCINTWDFEEDIVTEDIVLYAKWISAEDAEISIGASQGAREEDTRIDIGAKATETIVKDIKSRRYNGKPYKPSVNVSILKGKKRVTLKKDRDYTLTYRNNTNAGTASAIIEGTGKYKGRVTKNFTIDPPINLADEATQTEVKDIKSRRYNGTPYEPSVSVSIYNGKKRVTLKKDRDYTFSYANNINPSTDDVKASVIIKGTGEYAGEVKKEFVIDPPINLEDGSAQVKIGNIKSKVYSGKVYEPNVSISAFNGKKRVTLKKDRDYTLKYENNINASKDDVKASVTITGKGEYTGSVKTTFTITPKSVKKLKIYTGSKLTNDKSAPIVIYDGTTLLNSGWFNAEYIDLENPKKTKVTITPKATTTNYTDSVTVKLTVYDVEKQYYINSGKLEFTGDTLYTGKAITRNVKLTIGDTELRNNKDYKVQYQNNINAGTAVMTITGNGKYKGKIVRTFNIGKVDVNKYKVVEGIPQHVTIADISPKTFNGKAQEPAVTIKTIKNKKLALNKDYIVAYANNFHSGKASVTIKGIGNNCNGSTTIKFEIEPQEIKKVSVKVTKATEEEPSKVVLTYNKKELKEFADYAITNYSELANKKVSVTIQGVGDFKGEVTKTLNTEVPEEDEDVNGSSPAISTNINGHNYSDFEGSHINSYLYQNDDNTLVRVECIGNNNVCVESYTSDYKFISQKIIKMELSKFGGFYAGKDYYFLAFGERNPNKDDTQEILRVVKYDKNWNRIDETRLFGANTLDPFKNGSLRMTACEDILYIRTCHQMYNTHQANISLTIQISTMEIQQQITGVSNLSYTGYVSHSFNQYVLVDDDNTLLTVDQGDAYPRSVVLVKYNKKAPDANAFGGNRYVHVLPMGGSGAFTGVSVGAFEVSDTAYLVAGNSVDQKANPYSTGTIRNIFVTSTQKDNFSADGTTEHWITNHKYIEYTDAKGNPQKVAEAVVTTPHLVKLNGNEFMLLWTETVSVIEENKPVKSIVQKSILLNGNGEPISGIYSFDKPLSDCKPLVVNGNVTWYYTNKSEPVFCTLNPDDVRKQPK